VDSKGTDTSVFSRFVPTLDTDKGLGLNTELLRIGSLSRYFKLLCNESIFNILLALKSDILPEAVILKTVSSILFARSGFFRVGVGM